MAARSRQHASDAELMSDMQAGDLAAFGGLYERYARRAHRVARLVSHDGERADDAVQEAFLSMWHRRAGYRRERGPVDAWVFGIVRHRAIDGLRDDRRHERRVAALERSAGGPGPAPSSLADRALARESARRLAKQLDALPMAQRDVIVLAYVDDLSHHEIALRLGLPLGTVKGRMRLGLDKLRRDVAA
jgi:RNA polymerase sigma-70 factor (ECF subfamily)